MLNRVVLIGRVTRDLELRRTATDIAVVRFTVAVDRRYTNAQGEREADFISVTAWRGLAESCANYVRLCRSHLVVPWTQRSPYLCQGNLAGTIAW
ncbi:single-stranded DNA-binding protein [Pasteuria penetrans]|uniref:single-stranded DNA-binding protein n=1 Tax=Pasteuria penetrans TaxID=86005 RepID=UPI0011EC5447